MATKQLSIPSITSLAFDERLALLVDAAWLARENRRLARALIGPPDGLRNE